jgi:hypothetical protein
MNRVTGWLGADPEPGTPMPTSSFILAHRAAPDAGRTLQEIQQGLGVPGGRRDRERDDPDRQDFDEKAARMITLGYAPGMLSRLHQELGDTMAELADEQARIEKAGRRQEQVMRAHEAGRITAWQIPEMLGDDDGDPGRVSLLERRAASLRARIEDASAMISPPQRQRDPDPVAEAGRRAHDAFVSATRARWAEAEAAARQRPAPRPFGSASAAGAAEPDLADYARYDGREIPRPLGDPATCADCEAVGATPAQRVKIHAGAL